MSRDFLCSSKGLVTREDEEQQTDSRNMREDKRSLLNRATSKYGRVWAHARKPCSRPSNDDLLAILVKRQQIIWCCISGKRMTHQRTAGLLQACPKGAPILRWARALSGRLFKDRLRHFGRSWCPRHASSLLESVSHKRCRV